MLVNKEPSANVNEVKLDAPSNAPEPMLVTPDGMVTDDNLTSAKAQSPNEFTDSGIIYEPVLPQGNETNTV